jgi:hypothetical protein
LSALEIRKVPSVGSEWAARQDAQTDVAMLYTEDTLEGLKSIKSM